MLYDQHRKAPAVINHLGLSPEDVEAFCDYMGYEFVWVGEPSNMEDQDVFRVGSVGYPTTGHTIKFAKVAEWKKAMAAIGPMIFDGGRYRRYQESVYTTICRAIHDDTCEPMVIFRDEQGQVLTQSVKKFFALINFNGTLIASVSYEPNAQDQHNPEPG